MSNKTRNKRTTRKPKQPNLVVVTVTDTKDGRKLDVATSGNIKQTEAPTLLKLAAKISEQQLGLE
jgi:ribosomal protein L28